MGSAHVAARGQPALLLGRAIHLHRRWEPPPAIAQPTAPVRAGCAGDAAMQKPDKPPCTPALSGPELRPAACGGGQAMHANLFADISRHLSHLMYVTKWRWLMLRTSLSPGYRLPNGNRLQSIIPKCGTTVLQYVMYISTDPSRY